MRRAIPVLLAAAALAGALVARPLELYEVATLPFQPNGGLAAGDADHDGRPELYLFRPESLSFVLERTRGFRFDSTLLHGSLHAQTFVLSDFDHDGRADLVVNQAAIDHLTVFESPSPESLPTRKVWYDSVPDVGYWCVRTGHADADSLEDFVMKWEAGGGQRVYECKGDNDYECIASLFRVPPAFWPQRAEITKDLDRDGLPEVVTGDCSGWLTFYEEEADDSLVPVIQCSLPTSAPRRYAYVRALLGTPDLDQDGRDELFALVVSVEDVAFLFVLESPSDDSFEIVWRSEYAGNYAWEQGAGYGDLDGDSVTEVVIDDGAFLRVFRVAGNDTFELIWTGVSVYAPFAVVDIDGDGRDEIVGQSGREETKVLSTTPACIAEQERVEVEERPGPTVLRAPDLARFEGRILDALGREVRSATSDFGVCTSPLPPGVYFLESEARSPNGELRARKVVLTR